MLTLFHAPQSRSEVITALIEAMGIGDRVHIETVSIARQDGSGGPAEANPHPEGKVPALVHDGAVITERAAIILHLTGLFPDTGLSPAPGSPDWGRFATWLCWYQGVMEPVIVHEFAQVSHPVLQATFRDHAAVVARLRAALDKGPWLLGDRFSAADLLVHSPYGWYPAAMPDDAVIRDWVARCIAKREAGRDVAA